MTRHDLREYGLKKVVSGNWAGAEQLPAINAVAFYRSWIVFYDHVRIARQPGAILNVPSPR